MYGDHMRKEMKLVDKAWYDGKLEYVGKCLFGANFRFRPAGNPCITVNISVDLICHSMEVFLNGPGISMPRDHIQVVCEDLKVEHDEYESNSERKYWEFTGTHYGKNVKLHISLQPGCYEPQIGDSISLYFDHSMVRNEFAGEFHEVRDHISNAKAELDYAIDHFECELNMNDKRIEHIREIQRDLENLRNRCVPDKEATIKV
jgi:hypothetical protein